ncbi:MAG: carboxymuconolactone decarboxylase family protein [Solirubrobacterales bacterium]|nr:carboxymuconolactone decarboxylase family protein [Solirubrobacterales bacterium]
MLRNPKQPRVEPVAADHDDATAAALAELGPPIALFGVLARRPDRARAIAQWGRYYLSRRVALTLRQRELVIDRTTALCGADYEWGIHIEVFAEKAGLTDTQIASLAGGRPTDPCWSDRADAAVLQAVDELHLTNDLRDETWNELAAAIGEEGAVDLILIAGWYHAISFAVRALRLTQEPGTPRLAI